MSPRRAPRRNGRRGPSPPVSWAVGLVLGRYLAVVLPPPPPLPFAPVLPLSLLLRQARVKLVFFNIYYAVRFKVRRCFLLLGRDAPGSNFTPAQAASSHTKLGFAKKVVPLVVCKMHG